MTITLKFNSKCWSCKKPMRAGTSADWNKAIRKVFCFDCVSKKNNERNARWDTPPTKEEFKPVYDKDVPKEERPTPTTDTYAWEKLPETNDGRNYFLNFNNVSELERYVDSASDFSYESHANRSPDWCPLNFSTARECLRTGNQTDYENASKLIDKFVVEVSAHLEQDDIIYDITGEELDIASFLQGIPEYWMSTEQRKLQTEGIKLLHVVVNYAASSGITAETIIKKGSVVMALVELLEISGIKVQLDLQHGFGAAANIVVTTRVKDYDDSLNRYKIAFMLCNPAMLRRIGFSVQEHLPKELRARLDVRDRGSSYGYVYDYTPTGDNVLYISGSKWTDVRSNEDMERLLTEELKKQGVNFRTKVV